MQISTFDFNGTFLEVYGTFDIPYFIASQVAEILSYQDTDKAIRNHVDEDEKIPYSKIAYLKYQARVGMRTLTDEASVKKTPPPRTILITEAGLYSLVLSSKLPMAKEFKKWVCKEVIPSIRRQGKDSMVLELRSLRVQNKALISNKKSLESKLEKRERTKYPKGNCIYIVHCPISPNFYKIGRTSNLSARLGNYNTSCHTDFKIKYCRYTEEINAIETLLFYILEIFRVKNSKEWFYSEDYTILEREVKMVIDFIERERRQYSSPNSGFNDIKEIEIPEEIVLDESQVQDDKPWIPQEIKLKPQQRKICCTCKKDKFLSEFYCNKGNKDGLERRCKQCRQIVAKKVNENCQVGTPETKECLRCTIVRPASQFYKNRNRKDLLNNICKICDSLRVQKLKEAEKEVADIKKCSTCNETKSILEFYTRSISPDGHMGQCKVCCRIRERKWKQIRLKNMESLTKSQVFSSKGRATDLPGQK